MSYRPRPTPLAPWFYRPSASSLRVALGLTSLLCIGPLACGDDGAGDGHSDDELGQTDSAGDSETSTSTESGTEASEGEAATDTAEAPNFTAGFALADLSPSDTDLGEDLYMGGYGLFTERGPADGVHDPIFVRAMALGVGEPGGDDGDGALFAIVDTVGFGNRWTRQIRSEVAAATGLDPDRVIIGATHTHGGPDFQGLWGGVPDLYRERVIATIVETMSEAWAKRVPARIEAASTTADNRNRRGWEFTDDSLLALSAFDLDQGDRLGLMVVFAAHPVIVGSDNLLITRDFCGYTVDALEAELDAPVLFFNAAQGDVSPQLPEGMWPDDYARAEAYGEHVAARTLDVLLDGDEIAPALHQGSRTFSLDVTNELFLFAGQSGLIDYDFEMSAGGTYVDTQTTYFRLGDNQVQLLAFPGESLTRNGLAIKAGMSAPHQAILGLSGDSLGYFVPTDEWNTGLNDNYEESVSVGIDAADITRDHALALIAADPWAG